jgi:uncharacterized protein YdeI (YjbR/CyaY-like superfamily)
MAATPAPRHFRTPAAFAAWLEKNHTQAGELIVGFYKKASGKGGITYGEALDEALCWGWIDGVRRSVDAVSYSIRFSPRKPDSKWSKVNLEHYARLQSEGRIRPPGAEAFARFDPEKHTPYSFEARITEFSPELLRRFEAAGKAWAFFQQQPPGYRRTATHWVTSAKREETRLRRLDELIEVSADGIRLPQVSAQPSVRKKGGKKK